MGGTRVSLRDAVAGGGSAAVAGAAGERWALVERAKELGCLHRVLGTLSRSRGDLERALGEIAGLIPGGMRFPAAAAARIRLGGGEARGGHPGWSGPVLRVPIEGAGEPGTLEVSYPGPLPATLVNPFLPEERTLLRSISEALGEAAGRQRAERDLAVREARLLQRQEQLDLALSSFRGGVWAVAFDDGVVGARAEEVTLSPPLRRLLGWGDDAPVTSTSPWRAHVLPEDRPRYDRAAADHLAGRTADLDLEYRVRGRDGGVRWVHSTGRIQRDEGGRPVRWTGILWDVTERRGLEEQLRRLAFRDALTGLPNRALLERRLAAAVSNVGGTGLPLAVLYLDVDRLKAINDTLGHRAGDAALVALARRVEEALRPGDLLARLGGDERVAVLPAVSGEAEAVAVAERVLAALTAPLELPAGRVQTALSVGIALSWGGVGADSLLRLADLAMYRAKRRGGHTWELAKAEAPAPPVVARRDEGASAVVVPMRRGILRAAPAPPVAEPGGDAAGAGKR
jgi:diguanylate cyclase (GGDEF)-like protein/PAS domain S-box-containing protein